MSFKRVQMRILGRVQGVGYRSWFQRTAEEVGVSGWVRNSADGSVEAVVEGDQAAVDELYSQALLGPDLAQVESIEVSPLAGGSAQEFSGFTIKW